MNIKKYIFLFFFFSGLYQGYSQNTIADKAKKKNAIEISFFTLQTSKFAFPNTIIPEYGYSRYLGQYIKLGTFYRHFKYVSQDKVNEFGLKVGFLLLPLIIKDVTITNKWEVELNFNYAYQVVKGQYKGSELITKNHRIFARLGISRKFYKNFHIFTNIDIWNRNLIYMGLRYSF